MWFQKLLNIVGKWKVHLLINFFLINFIFNDVSNYPDGAIHIFQSNVFPMFSTPNFANFRKDISKQNLFSSPEHEVLKVSFVIAFCPASVNIFSSVTSWSTGMKIHRKHSLNDLTRIPNLWDPCIILVYMATK